MRSRGFSAGSALTAGAAGLVLALCMDVQAQPAAASPPASPPVSAPATQDDADKARRDAANRAKEMRATELAVEFMGLFARARYEEVLPKIAEALALYREAQGEGAEFYQTMLNFQALSLRLLGRWAEALPLYQRHLELTVARVGEEHADTLSSLTALSAAYAALNRREEARTIQERRLALSRKLKGERHDDTIGAMTSLAATYALLRRQDLALPLFEAILAHHRDKFGEGHSETLAAKSNLAVGYSELGRVAEALALQRDVIRLRSETLGPDHEDTLTAVNNLGRSLVQAGLQSEALGLLEPALPRARALKDQSLAQSMSGVLAGAYNAAGQPGKAAPLYRELWRGREASLGAEQPLTIAALANLAYTLMQLGEYTEGLQLTERALELSRRRLGEDDPGTAASWVNYAAALERSGRLAEAQPAHERALALFRARFGERHPSTLTAQNNLAFNLNARGRHAEAVAIYLRLIDLRTEVSGPRHPDSIGAINNLAAAYSALGELSHALPLYERALQLSNETLGETHPDSIAALGNMADILGALGRNADALPLLERVRELRIKNSGERHPATLTALNNLAYGYSAMGDSAKAAEVYQRVTALRIEILGEAHPATLSSVNNYAAVLLERNQSAQALALLEHVEPRAREGLGARHPLVLTAMGNRATALNAQRRHAEALALYTTLRETRLEILGRTHPDTLLAGVNLAETLVGLGRRAEAAALFAELLPDVEALRASGALSPENRQALFARWVDAYKHHASLLTGLGRAEEAFRVSELSKARTLLESTALRRAGQASVLAPAEARALRDFETQLVALDNAIAAASERPEVRLRIEAEKNARLREFAALHEELGRRHPKYRELSEVRIIDQRAGRALLAPDAVLVSYLVREREVLAFTLTLAGGLRVRALPAVGLADLVRRYRRLLSDPASIRETAQAASRAFSVASDAPGQLQSKAFSVASDAAAARQAEGGAATPQIIGAAALRARLGELLLEPLREELAGKRHWIIAPDDVLALLPFEALGFAGEPALARHDLSYVQSLSMLALLSQRDTRSHLRTRRSLLAVGGAQYERAGKPATSSAPPTASTKEDGEGAARTAAASGPQLATDAGAIRRYFEQIGVSWSNLPGSEREVETIAKIFGANDSYVLKGAQATESRLTEMNAKGELARYRYLLFSTHGYLSTEEPALSAVVLGQLDNPPGVDGYVTASKWPGYALASDLIVLSACETGLGRVVKGEGVLGLPYALYVAGNRNTLLSLWPVVDESTSVFMSSFFRRLKSGKSQVRALNDTKREFLKRKDYAGPLFWAPFVLYGN